MLLIGNGVVITRNEGGPLIQNGGVLVDGTRIIKVGEYEALKKEYPDTAVMDVKGKLIMPGLINAHEHIYSPV